jgi:hypothetical protein
MGLWSGRLATSIQPKVTSMNPPGAPGVSAAWQQVVCQQGLRA